MEDIKELIEQTKKELVELFNNRMQEIESGLKVETSKPDFNFPWWIKKGVFIARDKSGDWYCYDGNPTQHSDSWSGDNYLTSVLTAGITTTEEMDTLSWKESLYINE